MRTTLQRSPPGERLRILERALIGAALFMAMLLLGVQIARASDATTARENNPATTAYRFSSHPMISGTVVTVNDHQMVVNTDQGEQVTLEMDTRTMAPRDLGPGMVMRAEFVALDDCRFYAQRIRPIRGGMSTHRLQSYANTRDRGVAPTRSASTFDGRWESGRSQAVADRQEPRPRTVGEHSPGAIMTATSTTADYQFSTRPMISGRVVSVNDHRLVVETNQGQQVGLVMDSRTMVPGEVAPGTLMRAEFTQMEDGRYYAHRVSSIDRAVADREQTYAQTRDSDGVIARDVPECGFVSAATPGAPMSVMERRGEVATAEPVLAQRVAQPVAVAAPVAAAERLETLPQTASHQPLILLLGLFALGSAGACTLRWPPMPSRCTRTPVRSNRKA